MKKLCFVFILFILIGAQVFIPAEPVKAEPLVSGLWITRLIPAGASGHPFDTLEIMFSGNVKDGSFTLADVSVGGPGGAITPVGLTKLAADRYSLDLSGLTGLGSYTLTIGPNILDSGDQALDQNHNGVGGQPEDAYNADLLSSGLTIADDNLTFDGRNLVLYGTAFTINGTHTFASLEVVGGTILKHSAATAVSDYRLELTLTDGLWVDAASKIDASGAGYLPGRTVGNTTTGQATGFAGGSYGGLGAFRFGVPNQSYGDYKNPDDPGSGSGNANTYSTTGSSGGGLVRITAGTAQIEGSVLSSGSGPNSDGSSGPAAGSGGGIYLKVGTLSGSGFIRADGGKNGWGSQEGGAGGGGRVAVYYDTLNGFDLNHISANSGTVSYYSLAAVGTVYLKQTGNAGVLRLDSQGSTYAAGAWTPLGIASDTSFEAEDVIISGEGVVAAPQHEMPVQVTNLTLSNKAVLTHQPATTTEIYSLRLTVTGTLTIDANAKIDATGRGYLPGRTLGNTTAGQSTGLAGGSYGGLGAFRFGVPNQSYGDYKNPDEPGSGSGNANTYSTTGSSGGGLVRITAGTAQIEGSVLSSGSGPNSDGSSGPAAGSGGGIYLKVGTLSGSGFIRADGGKNGWGGQEGGAGGGGRVAVYYDTLNGFDLNHVSANSGTASYYSLAAVGTVYLKQTGSAGVLRLDSQGSAYAAGAWTPLGIASDTSFEAEDVIISGEGVVAAPQHEMPVQVTNLTLSNKAVLTHQPATTTEIYSLRLTVNGTLTIDANAKIDVSGRGYLPGRTLGNTTAGQSTGTAGGSYGGLGGPRSTDSVNRIYGDPANPIYPGSGSGNANTFSSTGSAGGGVVRITAGSVVVNGAILAKGASASDAPGPGAGSGGSILLNVNTLSGSGLINANGGSAGWSGGEGGGGGGGRVAIYFRGGNTLASANVTADGGFDAYGGSHAGSVVITNQAAYLWSAPRDNLFHGVETVGWSGLGQSGLNAQVELLQAGAWLQTLGNGLPAEGSLAWNTTAVPDGLYELRVIFRNASLVEAGRASRLVLVNNAVAWHSGDIASSENWDSSKVHVLEADLAVNPGVTLSIQPGTVIKSASQVEFFVQSGGILNAAGSSGSPIILTSLADDSVGGDTNLDSAAGRPQPGDWRGLSTLGSGQANLNSDVEVRYVFRTHSGVLPGSESWKGTDLHFISGDVTVPLGATLTIQPGAVVKFDSNKMLHVAAGGTLNASGLASQPIYFTSFKDDTVAGDSNLDGAATSPNPGDWVTLRISGSATLNHIIERYASGSNGGGYQSFSGFVTAEAGSTLTLSNSLLQDGLYDGLIYRSAVTVTSTILVNAQRGLFPDSLGSGTFNNLVIDQTNHGVLCHGGTAQINNSVIYRSVIRGVSNDCATLRYSNVWSETGLNYGVTNQTGLLGNISVEPKFISADARNYRPTFGSPLIDAADSPLAPATDWMGAPRYDDPRSANTGTANPDGSFADMGAFEFAENAPSDLDLVATAIEGPQTAVAGSPSQITYTVVNQGSGTLHGPWRDEIGLAGAAELAGETVSVGSGLSLGPGQSHTFQVTVRTPGGVEGVYHWQVKANNRGDIFEGQNRGNNTGLSVRSVNLQVPELVPGGSVLSGSFANVGQPHWFKLNAAAGQDFQVILDNSDNSTATEMTISRSEMPTFEKFDFRQNPDSGDLNQVFHSPAAATYYILARAVRLPGGAQGFTLRARLLGFEITSSSPNLVGNTGSVLTTLRGGGFKPGDIYEVVAPNAVAYQAKWINFIDSSEVQAQFDFSNLPLGAYALRVREGSNAASLNGSLTVEIGKPPVIVVSSSHPKEVRRYSVPTIIFNYTNSSNIDLPPALLNIKINNSLPEFQSFGVQLARSQNSTATDQILGVMIPALGPYQSGQFIVGVSANTPGEFPLSINGLSIGMDSSQFARPLDRYAKITPHLIQATGDSYLHTLFTVQTSSGTGDLDFQLNKERTTTQVAPTISMIENGNLRTWNYEMTANTATDIQGDKLPGADTQSFLSKLWSLITGAKDTYDNVNKIADYKNAVDLLVTQKQIDECLTRRGFIDPSELSELERYSDGALTLKIMTEAAGQLEGADAFGAYLDLMNGAMEPGWKIALYKFYKNNWMNYGNPWEGIATRYNPDNPDDLVLAVIKECFVTIEDKTNSTIKVKESEDPNQLSGPVGYGAGNYIDSSAPLNYMIEFENKPTATLPAQEVVVTNQLDVTKFDLSTFQLGPVWIGKNIISIPPGKDSYSTELDLRPDNNLILKMDASINPANGLITWRFTSLDPLTRTASEDTLAGFLPPNKLAPEGQGGVSYMVSPIAGQPTGTVIQNQASITFDYNPPIQTGVWSNTLDAEAPTSSIQALPAVSYSPFVLSWQGSDGSQGSGITSYDIYVSENGGAFKLWKTGLTALSARFYGQAGHTYGFYSVAVDGTGHRQLTPSAAQSITKASGQIFLPVISH